MAWTSTGQIRIVDSSKVYKPFTPAEWYCDPCNLPSKRYMVRSAGGQEIFYHWFEVITPLDDHRTRVAKWEAAKQHHNLAEVEFKVRQLFQDAERGYRETDSALRRAREIISAAI